MKLLLQKKCKIFERWGLRPHTPVPPAAGGFAPKPPDPHWPPAAGGSAPRPPKQPPHCEFLATRLLAVHICNEIGWFFFKLLRLKD